MVSLAMKTGASSWSEPEGGTLQPRFRQHISTHTEHTELFHSGIEKSPIFQLSSCIRDAVQVASEMQAEIARLRKMRDSGALSRRLHAQRAREGPRGQTPMVAVAIRMIFDQLDAAHVQRQLKEVVSTLKRQFRTVAEQTLEAGDDVTAFKAIPISHWTNFGSLSRLSE